MSRGYLILAQDTKKDSYTKLAYALALSIKNSQSIVNKVALATTSENIPDKYHEVFGTYSTSMINGSPYQAFRAGYREGVKMSLDAGNRVSPPDFSRKIWIYNLHKLLIWCSIGADVENGIWSTYGAKLGAYDCNLTDWDYTQIGDYDWFNEKWKSINGVDPVEHGTRLGEELRKGLNINVTELDAIQSKFFKTIYINPPRPMVCYEQIKHLSAS